MKLFSVPVSHIGVAWADGASKLAEATNRAKREITPDQLKMLLLRGERTLLGLADDSHKPQAWAAVQIQVLPNLRTLYIYAIYAPGNTGPEAFNLLKQYARDNGCETIRGACEPSVGRLFTRKHGANIIYSVYEIETT
jgi:hypothetical protein